MTWYPILTSPGASKPYARTIREIINPVTKRTGLVRHADNHRSVVEASMEQAGIEFYIAFESETIRHPKTKKWITRRKPLIPGYVFAKDITDWPAFEALKGISGPIRIRSAPVPIAGGELERLMDAERMVEQARLARLVTPQTKKARLAARYPSGSKVRIPHGHLLSGREAFVIEATARNTIRAIITAFGGQVDVEIDADNLEEELTIAPQRAY